MKGVAFNDPPEVLLPSIMDALTDTLAQLPPDKQGALVGLVTETGVNAAVVSRLPQGWAVQAWIGKRWIDGDGGLGVGASVMRTW
jgi:hypothetical protein